MIEIVGKGAIACALERANAAGQLNTGIDRTFFAAGVSNPNETNLSQFYRELMLLLEQKRQGKNQQLVYFSTLGVLSTDDRMYFRHKRTIEGIIIDNFPLYCIARLGILIESAEAERKNPHTTINFLRGCLKAGTSFSLRNVSRNVVEEKEFIEQINNLPIVKGVVNINGTTMTEKQMFDKYVNT